MKSFKKTIGTDSGVTERDYLYYWQLWHHNWDDEDISLVRELIELPGKSVLEVGCGDGRLTFGLAAHCASIVGIDTQELFVQSAISRINHAGCANIQFHTMNAESLTFSDDAFDVVLYPWVLQMVSDKVAALREAYRVLKPGGQLLVTGLLSDADYDHIIARFVSDMVKIDPAVTYEQPLTAAFGAGAHSLSDMGVRQFSYFFETVDIAQEAFLFALDRWYGTALDLERQRQLRSILESFGNEAGRVRIQFPAAIYLAQKSGQVLDN